MKYIRQLTIIMGISFVGELLNKTLPLPVPASIYGLIIMLILLSSGLLKISHIKETSNLLLDAMPIMFIPAAAGIIKYWGIIKPILLPCIIMMLLVTAVVMVVTGVVTQKIINHNGKEKPHAQ